MGGGGRGGEGPGTGDQAKDRLDYLNSEEVITPLPLSLSARARLLLPASRSRQERKWGQARENPDADPRISPISRATGGSSGGVRVDERFSAFARLRFDRRRRSPSSPSPCPPRPGITTPPKKTA